MSKPDIDNKQPKKLAEKPPLSKMAAVSLLLAVIFPPAGFITALNSISIINRTNQRGKPLAILAALVSTMLIILFAALVMPKIFMASDQVHEQSRDRARQKAVNLLQAELEEYHQANDYYPGSLEPVKANSPDYIFIHNDIGEYGFRYDALPEGCEQCTQYSLNIELESGEEHSVKSQAE